MSSPKQKPVTYAEYAKHMDAILALNTTVAESLIAMLSYSASIRLIRAKKTPKMGGKRDKKQA